MSPYRGREGLEQSMVFRYFDVSTSLCFFCFALVDYWYRERCSRSCSSLQGLLVLNRVYVVHSHFSPTSTFLDIPFVTFLMLYIMFTFLTPGVMVHSNSISLFVFIDVH